MTINRARGAKPSWNYFLRACARLQRGNLIAVIVFSFLVNLLMLTTPLYMLQIFNRVLPSKSIDTLLFLTAIVVVAVITLTILEASRRFVFLRFGAWLDARLGGLVLSGSIAHSVEDSRKSSSKGLKELSRVRRLFASSSLFPILDIPWTPIFLLVLFSLHPLIGLIALIGSICLLLLALLNEYSHRELKSAADEASGAEKTHAAAILRNADVVEAMGMRQNVINAWEVHHSKAVDLQTRVSVHKNRIASVASFLRVMLQVTVIGTAAYLVINSLMSAGGLIASLLLMRRAVAPLDSAVTSWKSVAKGRLALERVSDSLDQAPELRASPTLPLPTGYLSVRNVEYRYPKAPSRTLRGVTFRAQPGEVIGLVGDSAAGKSTLARLLVGISAPMRGYARLGGVDIAHWSAEDRGPAVGYLPQNADLFPGSVRQNIARMGEGNFAAVEDAAQLAAVDEFVKRFPEGYDTQVGDDGAYLSGGQQQRIALARAIYGNPKLLVLDEPDANLDSAGRAALAATIAELKRRGAIVVIITHRNSLLACVDELVVLRNGRIQVPLQEGSKRTSSRKTADSQIVDIGPRIQGEE